MMIDLIDFLTDSHMAVKLVTGGHMVIMVFGLILFLIRPQRWNYSWFN